jgi:catechol 2,3-dioxygenase-like lactoylglutathione lyase family enzyme
MAFHHVALATRDLAATHRFYTEAMGFTLVKAVVAPTGNPGGWAKHVFYDTGDGELMAFWEIFDDALNDFDPAISTSQGLPEWVNHLAFSATVESLATHRDRWLANGIDVAEVDHDFCVSIYATDPNGILVEWCATVRDFTDEERREAVAMVPATDAALPAYPPVTFHLAADFAAVNA